MDVKVVKVNDSRIISKAMCPVCLKVPGAHIFQCENGHPICEVCSTNKPTCPTCQSSKPRIRNQLAENLLDAMEFKCRYSSCGELMKRGQILLHDEEKHLFKLLVPKGPVEFMEVCGCGKVFERGQLSLHEEQSGHKNDFKLRVPKGPVELVEVGQLKKKLKKKA